jgi:hypothetical protein
MLSLSSSPLPALDANLSLQMTESFSFGEKQSTGYFTAASIGTKLYRDVSMTTDFGYTQTESLETDEQTSTRYINGSLSAVLTPRLSGDINYRLNWTETADESFDSQGAGLQVTYRPGRFISLTGRFSMVDQNGDLQLNEGARLTGCRCPR